MSAAVYVIVCMALTEVIDLSIGGSKRPDVNTLVRMYITLFITLLDLLTATHLYMDRYEYTHKYISMFIQNTVM